jgi:GT2 family glycosyltransferase
VILSYNRRELVRRTLESIRRQSLTDAEVIVVDNASIDGTPDMVRACFPHVKLLALEENSGVRGRNRGFEAANGRVILSLDDDIELCARDTLDRLVRRFDAEPMLGALSLKICDPPAPQQAAPEHWWHPVPRDRFQDREFETDHINEAAVAFRREALARVGGYYEDLFWGGEEWDLTLGLMDAGFTVRYLPEPVLHLAPRGDLNIKVDARHALLVRNRCWIAFRRLPIVAAIGFVVPRLILWALRSVRYGYLRHYLAGVTELIRSAPRILRSRRAISSETYRRILALKRQALES